MNERAQELIQKAGFPEWSNKTIGFELEQFAKLIIEECLSLCEDERDIFAIKEHFGVE